MKNVAAQVALQKSQGKEESAVVEGGLVARRIRGQTQCDRVCQGLYHTPRAPVPLPKTSGHTFHQNTLRSDQVGL